MTQGYCQIEEVVEQYARITSQKNVTTSDYNGFRFPILADCDICSKTRQ